MPPASLTSPLAMVGLATVGLALKGIFAKLAMLAGAALLVVLLLRIALAAPAYALIVRWQADPGGVLSGRDRALALLCGCLFSAASISDFYVLTLMDVGLSRAVLFTYPLVVQALGMLHERRRPSRAELTSFALSYGGLMLMVGPASGVDGRVPPAGVALSLLSALCYGSYLYYGQNVSRRLGSSRFTAWSNTSTLVLLLALAPFLTTPADYALSATAWGWVICLAVFSTVLPFVLLFEGMRHIDAAQATLITLSGPVITVAVAAWAFGERLSPLQLAGFVLVVAGVAWLKRPGLIRAR